MKVIVVGSGFSALGAVQKLIEQGIRPLVLDQGHTPSLSVESSPEVFRLGTADEHFQSNLRSHVSISPLLDAPSFSHVAKIEDESPEYILTSSEALGGLGNAWGGGAFRFNPTELAKFPGSSETYQKIYDKISPLLSVHSTEDDLSSELGSPLGPQPKIGFCPSSTTVLKAYSQRKTSSDFLLGRPRLSLHPHLDDVATQINFNEHPENRFFFNPSLIFKKWIQQDLIDYLPRHQAQSWSQRDSQVEVFVRNQTRGTQTSFFCDRLFLATGVVPTAKLVARSAGCDVTTQILDNPGVQIPFFRLGALTEKTSAEKLQCPTFQLTSLFQTKNPQRQAIANFISLRGLRDWDLAKALPLPLPWIFSFQEFLIERLLVAYVFLSCDQTSGTSLKISPQGDLSMGAPPPQINWHQALHDWQTNLRKWNLWTFAAIWRKPRFGASLHLAGTFPFNPRSHEKPWTTDSLGRLGSWSRVHLIDGSVFPFLPAKNYSMTLVANAYRTVEETISKEH